MTVGELLKSSLRLIGAIATGETPSNDEMKDALSALNTMLDGWSAHRLTVYATTQESLTLTAADYEYTIGSSGNLNTTKPVKVLSAFTRDSSGQDYPVEVYTDRERYNALIDKDASGRPEELFYVPSHPLGYLYLYPAPDTAYTLYIESLKPLSALSGYTTEISLPTGYERALKYNLAIELAPEFGVSVPAEVAAVAMESYRAIANVNAPTVMATMDVPYTNGVYNIYTGR